MFKDLIREDFLISAAVTTNQAPFDCKLEISFYTENLLKVEISVSNKDPNECYRAAKEIIKSIKEKEL